MNIDVPEMVFVKKYNYDKLEKLREAFHDNVTSHVLFNNTTYSPIEVTIDLNYVESFLEKSISMEIFDNRAIRVRIIDDRPFPEEDEVI